MVAEAVPGQVFLAADANGGLLLCLVSSHTMQLQALQLRLQRAGAEQAHASVRCAKVLLQFSWDMLQATNIQSALVVSPRLLAARWHAFSWARRMSDTIAP